MKRLLCIISAMNTGGAETFLMKLYRKLDRTKFQMDFCVNAPEKGFYDEEIASMDGRIYRIPCKSSDLSGFRQQLTNVVRENRYDYVLRITASGAGLMDLKLAKKAGASVCVARSSNSGSDGGLKSFLAHRIGRLLYSRYIDVRIAPSDLAAIYYASMAFQSLLKYTKADSAISIRKTFMMQIGIKLRLISRICLLQMRGDG